MPKILCFHYEEMAEFEVTFLLHRLRTVGRREIITIGAERELLVSQSGFTVMPQMTVVEALKLDDVEALIIPGGPICSQSADFTALIQKLYREEKLLAAICNGPQFLARAGIFAKRRYTTSATVESIEKLGLTDFFPRQNFRQERVVRDENVITATGRAFIDFAFAVFEYLAIFESPEAMQALYEEIRG
jgi:putative intracellular protease/amidase